MSSAFGVPDDTPGRARIDRKIHIWPCRNRRGGYRPTRRGNRYGRAVLDPGSIITLRAGSAVKGAESPLAARLKKAVRSTMDQSTDYRLEPQKRIALVAHDNKKKDLLEWAKWNRAGLAEHVILATGTTGKLLEAELGIEVIKLQSGPLGGDQQIGAKITDGEIDFLIFFWDPLEMQPHDTDVKALLRIAVVWNIPVACNRASADFIISSPLMSGAYQHLTPDDEAYLKRVVGME